MLTAPPHYTRGIQASTVVEGRPVINSEADARIELVHLRQNIDYTR